MPKRIQPLTELQIKKAKPAPKEFKLFDGGGLFLLVTPVGGKLWHFKSRFAGKEKKLAFGAYPIITLAEARQRREEAKRLLAGDLDPAEVRKARKEELETEQRTFERVALEWFAKNEPVWSNSHCNTVKRRLNHDIFPVFGSRPIAEIRRSDIIFLLIPSHNSEVGCDAPSFATAIHSELQLIATGCNPFFRITSSNITPYCVWAYLAHRNYYVFPRISCNLLVQGLDTTVLPGSLRRYGRTELSPVLAGEPGSGFGNVTVKLAAIPPSGNRKSHYL